MTSARAIVVGAGVGGLAAAVGLQRSGWQVMVLERGSGTGQAGSGISLWPNALRALGVLGVAGQVERSGLLSGRSGVRTPDGRWLAHTDIAGQLHRRYGLPLLLIRRQTLIDVLRSSVDGNCIRSGVTVTAVHLTGKSATVISTAGEHAADLVVIADGARSALRSQLFPAHPGLRYAGYTSWRLIAPRPDQAADPVEPAETWGRAGHRFAVLPLGHEHVYCYATANAGRGAHADDERAELQRRFGAWHDPIPQILDSITPGQVIRTDITDFAEPLPALHRGRALLLGDAAHAMTPDLGQGGCQALEDAATLAVLADGADAAAQLPARYTALRAARGNDIMRRSRRAGRLYQAPPLLARTAARLSGLLPSATVARLLAPIVDWQPPAGRGKDSCAARRSGGRRLGHDRNDQPPGQRLCRRIRRGRGGAAPAR